MKLEKLILQNFGSYMGRHELVVPNGVTYITATNKDLPGVYDSNGGGKTTLLNAICWALYGTTPSGLRGKSLLNKWSHDCRVILTLSDGLQIERSYLNGRAGVNVKGPGIDWKGDTRYIQAMLEKHMGGDDKIFFGCNYLGKNARSTQFLLAAPAKRAEVISDLIDDEIFQVAAEAVFRDLKSLENDVGVITWKQKALTERQAEAEESKAELESSAKEARAVEAARKVELTDRIRRCNEFVAKAQMVLLKKPVRSMKALEEDRAQHVLRIEHLNNAIRDLGGITPLRLSVGDVCPHCRNTVSAAHLAACTEEAQEAKEKRTALQREVQGLSNLVHDIQRQQQEIRDLDAEKVRAQRDFDFYKVEAAQAEEELIAPSLSVTAIQSQLDKVKEKIQNLAREYIHLDNTKCELQLKMNKLVVLKTGFGSEVRNFMFDKIRSQLDYYTKAFCQEIAGGSMQIEYPTTSRHLKEKFEIVVSSDGMEQDLSAYSGGENWRASLAVLLALRATFLNLSSSQVGFLMIDDPIGEVDKTGGAHFSRVLQKLVDDGMLQQVLVTIPNDEIAQGQIHIIKKGRCSSFARVGP